MYSGTIHIGKPLNRDRWNLDPERALVIVMDWPNQSVNSSLMMWLMGRFPLESIKTITRKDQVCARNTAIRDIAMKAPTRFSDFVMFDNDMRPTAYTDHLFEPLADIVCIQCDHGHGGAWSRPTDFHCNGFRFTRKVLENIPLPWFAKTYSEDGCDLTGCSCQHFRDLALEAGMTIQRSGTMLHGGL